MEPDIYRVVISGLDGKEIAEKLAGSLDQPGRKEAGIVITVRRDRDGIPPFDETDKRRTWVESL